MGVGRGGLTFLLWWSLLVLWCWRRAGVACCRNLGGMVGRWGVWRGNWDICGGMYRCCLVRIDHFCYERPCSVRRGWYCRRVFWVFCFDAILRRGSGERTVLWCLLGCIAAVDLVWVWTMRWGCFHVRYDSDGHTLASHDPIHANWWSLFCTWAWILLVFVGLKQSGLYLRILTCTHQNPCSTLRLRSREVDLDVEGAGGSTYEDGTGPCLLKTWSCSVFNCDKISFMVAWLSVGGGESGELLSCCCIGWFSVRRFRRDLGFDVFLGCVSISLSLDGFSFWRSSSRR